MLQNLAWTQKKLRFGDLRYSFHTMSQVFIPYYAFLGPYPDATLDPKEIEENIPDCEGHKPRIFSRDSLKMSFMSHKNFRSSPPATHTPTFLKWLEKVEVQKDQVWK